MADASKNGGIAGRLRSFMALNRRFLRYHYLRFKRLRGDPRTLAKGVAIGVFIGITPTIPLHTVLILFLCFFLEGNGVAAILASMVVSNPLTFFLQYFLSWWLGSMIFPGVLTWERMHEVLMVLQGHHSFSASMTAVANLGLDAIMVVLSGGIILALPFTLAAYIYTYRFFSNVRTRHKKRGGTP
ncbi:MAG: DUF2062 domain-containing protein [Thermodesulfobacteriota bacterium]